MQGRLIVTIRPAIAAESTLIKSMVRAENLDPTSLNWRHFLVAEADIDGVPRIVGIGQIKEYPGCQELGSLIVLPEYRGEGIAGILMAALEDRAGRPLYLMCAEKMQPFYEQHDYEQIGFVSAPAALKVKLAASLIFRLFGVRVIVMRKLDG